MDIVGSEIGQKMRSAIKAKLTELGCYVDDELPDYVMVMVANKRTRAQMSDDLQLFLGANTQLFVNWLHQVLKKLQEVTVNTALKPPQTEEPETRQDKITKEKKVKDKSKKDKKAPKEKHKKSDGSTKKSKKETKKKDKQSRKKVPKKSKKKSKSDEPIRLNVPPLLMNLEKDSEPSITDVFAGQILKNHGVNLEKSISEDTKALEEVKPLRKALKRNRFPIIDPATVSNVTDLQTNNPDITETSLPSSDAATNLSDESTTTTEVPGESIQVAAQKALTDLESMPREEQIREMNEIEAKIQGLKKKLADQMDSMSEDEDFLNIRTEAEELMNDFAEDVLQEISAAQNASSTPPLKPKIPLATPLPVVAPVPTEPEQLPQIELQLPKRPMRERLGARPEVRSERRRLSDERLTPERQPARVAREERERERRRHIDLPEKHRDEPVVKRLNSRVWAPDRDVGEDVPRRAGPASVVRVRPRVRSASGAPAPGLLMRAVADAHKSLLNVAPKPDAEPQVKRALVLPMRRTVESQNIVIQIQTDRTAVPGSGSGTAEVSDCEIDLDTESLTELAEATESYKSAEYQEPVQLGTELVGQRINYLHSHTSDSSTFDDDVIKIHNPTVDRERGPQFVVTLDGLDPNVFLAKKLKTEGLSDEIELRPKKLHRETSKENISSNKSDDKKSDEVDVNQNENENTPPKKLEQVINTENVEKQNSVNNKIIPEDKTSPVASETKEPKTSAQKRKSSDSAKLVEVKPEVPLKKRRASPIVFDMKEREKQKERQKREQDEEKKEKETEGKRERRESGGSDITVTTTSSRKYDALPSLPSTERRRLPCRAFPACRFGASCQFQHPRCKFTSACTRVNCAYWHPPAPTVAPVVASHVVPVSNYKSITAVSTVAPPVCRFFPACVNPTCQFLHPKPCRYGRNCLNRAECNFYHHDSPSTKWRSASYV